MLFSGGFMTNEQFLYLTYFGATVGGVALAACTALLLDRSLRQALQSGHVSKLLGRLFPTWLIMVTLLGFMSVSYMECKQYSDVISDRQYLIDKAQDIVYRMALALKIALFAYAIVVIPHLWSAAKSSWSDRKP